MSMSMKQIARHAFTESNNETYDVVRILSGIVVLDCLVLASWSVIAQHHPFDVQAFGIGIGALFTGLGAALKLKPESGGARVP